MSKTNIFEHVSVATETSGDAYGDHFVFILSDRRKVGFTLSAKPLPFEEFYELFKKPESFKAKKMLETVQVEVNDPLDHEAVSQICALLSVFFPKLHTIKFWGVHQFCWLESMNFARALDVWIYEDSLMESPVCFPPILSNVSTLALSNMRVQVCKGCNFCNNSNSKNLGEGKTLEVPDLEYLSLSDSESSENGPKLICPKLEEIMCDWPMEINCDAPNLRRLTLYPETDSVLLDHEEILRAFPSVKRIKLHSWLYLGKATKQWEVSEEAIKDSRFELCTSFEGKCFSLSGLENFSAFYETHKLLILLIPKRFWKTGTARVC